MEVAEKLIPDKLEEMQYACRPRIQYCQALVPWVKPQWSSTCMYELYNVVSLAAILPPISVRIKFCVPQIRETDDIGRHCYEAGFVHCHSDAFSLWIRSETQPCVRGSQFTWMLDCINMKRLPPCCHLSIYTSPNAFKIWCSRQQLIQIDKLTLMVMTK